MLVMSITQKNDNIDNNNDRNDTDNHNALIIMNIAHNNYNNGNTTHEC